MNKIVFERSYFFDSGIRFECRRCGACCTGAPGSVLVRIHEIHGIARYLKIDTQRLIEDYLCPFGGGYSIQERADGRCLFYDDGCAIYPVRPLQCKTFPFWFELLRSPKRWHKMVEECPGIGSGLLYSKDEIIEIVGYTLDAQEIDLLSWR